jgi:hypothetical protein
MLLLPELGDGMDYRGIDLAVEQHAFSAEALNVPLRQMPKACTLLVSSE